MNLLSPIYRILLFVIITHISSLNAGFWDWFFGTKSEAIAQETPIRTVPSWNEQKEAYNGYYAALNEELQKLTHVKDEFESCVAYFDSLSADQYSSRGMNIANKLRKIAMLSHISEVRNSDSFQKLKKLNLAPVIELCEEFKDVSRFPYSTDQEKANQCISKDADILLWHWDNVRATLEHYYGPKKPLIKKELCKRAHDIRTYYARKQSQIPRTLWERVFGDNEEAEKKLYELNETKNRAIHYLANQYEDQQNAQSLAEKTVYDIWQRENIVNAWREYAYVTQQYGKIGATRAPKKGTFEYKAVKAATENLNKYIYTPKQSFFDNTLDCSTRMSLLFGNCIIDYSKE